MAVKWDMTFFLYNLLFPSLQQLYVAWCVSKCQQNWKIAAKFAINKQDSSLESLLFLEMSMIWDISVLFWVFSGFPVCKICLEPDLSIELV